MSLQRTLRRPRILLTAFLLTMLTGCGNEQRTRVSGTVTIDAQPVSNGQIVFEPTGPGRLGIAQISEGAYTMPVEHGPTAGTYIVRITAIRPSGRKVKTATRSNAKTIADEQIQYIPAKYNDLSDLKTEISADGETIRDFSLQSRFQPAVEVVGRQRTRRLRSLSLLARHRQRQIEMRRVRALQARCYAEAGLTAASAIWVSKSSVSFSSSSVCCSSSAAYLSFSC